MNMLSLIILSGVLGLSAGSHISSSRQLSFWGASSRQNKCISQSTLTCYFRPTVGNTVEGLVTFKPIFQNNGILQRSCFVRITAEIKSLTPGLHGFHIHTFGDVRNDDGSSAGGHFSNPYKVDVSHGFAYSKDRHWGDLGNLRSNKNGIARYSQLDRVISLASILGRGMIIHAMEDLGPLEQPSGASGSRQAQCVIGLQNPNM